MSSKYSIDLIRQMAECDANYIRLLKLVPRLHRCRHSSNLQGTLAEFRVGERHTQPATVAITVLESYRYTTTLEIAQQPGEGEWVRNPVMQVRVYHDAHTAEVVSFQEQRNFQPNYPQPNPQMFQRDEKVQVNRFLGEWLSYCLETGRCLSTPGSVLRA
ncbi:MAG: hypothetical protein RLZZ385_421 [Pseudomonadota bacterium]|jgi:uncharacterized protein YqiB (DUF1249 family)